jgi:NADH dehydrogenase
MMDVVTGSFGYIGKYITRQLLEEGRNVKTITTHPEKPNPFGDQVQAEPYNFQYPERLTASLSGCDTLYNTYWIRFPYQDWTYHRALKNTETLFRCARQAGIRKIVHISVTNPALDDSLPYYRGKAQQEQALQETGVDYAILRPTLVFGKEDILVNNIAWTIRNFPLVPVFGVGDYRVQPIYVKDLAEAAVQAALTKSPPLQDAGGPEIFTYREFLELIARQLDRNPLFPTIPPSLGILLGRFIGLFVGDVLLTGDELKGLMQEKLLSREAPLGRTYFSDWLIENSDQLGNGYTSELERHYY